MINWKAAKKYWLKAYNNNEFMELFCSEEECLKAKEFVNKYAHKIRWAKSICELGIGTGKHMNYFVEKYPNKNYFGNDFNPEIIKIIDKLYPDLIGKCDITVSSTNKYLKRYIKVVDAIYTYNHLMYIPDDLIDIECTNISMKSSKYILIHEILTDVDYIEGDIKSFINFGIGRDYSEKFDDFILKEKELEIININDQEVEFCTYLFKKMG